jgi:hypothetical protein
MLNITSHLINVEWLIEVNFKVKINRKFEISTVPTALLALKEFVIRYEKKLRK